MFYTAYAVLVIGAGMALFLSERPLSATVVTWALFSFNVAAIVFVTPAFLNFVREVKKPSDDTQVLEELHNIREQLSELIENNGQPTEQITMKDILHATAVRPVTKAKEEVKLPAESARTSAVNTPPASMPDVKVTQAFAHTVHSANPSAAVHKPEQISLFDQSTQAGSTPTSEASNTADTSQENTPAATPVAPADAVITATVHVEESDVLCIRGEGGGLNWQEGIPMTDEGNDRWSYKASALTIPATCRIYLNDEISSFGDDIVLQPGQYLEISPSFPKVEA
jgi:hypothetical protein